VHPPLPCEQMDQATQAMVHNIEVFEKRRWQFRLWQLLVATSCVAVALAILHFSSTLAITLFTSVLPGAATAWLARRPGQSVARNAASVVRFAALWFLIYVLSLGPALKLTLAMGWNINLEIPYSPVVWLIRNTFLKGPLEWYLGIWT